MTKNILILGLLAVICGLFFVYANPFVSMYPEIQTQSTIDTAVSTQKQFVSVESTTSIPELPQKNREPLPDINITTPTYNTTWTAGTDYLISWIPSGSKKLTISLDLLDSKGVSIGIATGLLDYVSHYYWPVPINVAPGISSTFVIKSAPTTSTVTTAPITVLSPNNGEGWWIGTTQNIRYNVAEAGISLNIYILDAQNRDRYWSITDKVISRAELIRIRGL